MCSIASPLAASAIRRPAGDIVTWRFTKGEKERRLHGARTVSELTVVHIVGMPLTEHEPVLDRNDLRRNPRSWLLYNRREGILHSLDREPFIYIVRGTHDSFPGFIVKPSLRRHWCKPISCIPPTVAISRCTADCGAFRGC